MTLIYEAQRNRSALVILDGQHIEDGPVAKLWFNQPIPQTFHGQWVPSEPG